MTGIASIAAILVIAVMIGRHSNDVWQPNPNMRADVSADATIVKALQDANVPVDGLVVRSVGGVVVVRGTGDKTAVQQVLQKLNVKRVANLVTGYSGNDDAIRREAERDLANTRALDGCMFHVSCTKGVLLVTGTVNTDLQADAARDVLRGLDGVQQVKVQLSTRS
jgi:osmotically-inducible protein OsmY